MATMRLEIVSAERTLFEGDVDALVAPGAEGQLGILPHHAALMTMLQPGELRYRVGDMEVYLTIAGGFMEVTGDRVVVLADAAERVEEIDEARAQEAVQQAQERIANRTEDTDLEGALRSLQRARVRVAAVRRHRRAGPLGAPGSAPTGTPPLS